MSLIEEFLTGQDVIKILNDIQWELHNSGSHLLKNIKVNFDDVMITCISHGEGREKTPSCGVSLRKKVLYSRNVPIGYVHCFACGYKAGFSEFISNVFGYNDKGFYGQKWLLDNYISIEQNDRPALILNMNRTVSSNITYVLENELEKYRFYHPYMFERKLTERVINYFDVGYDKENNALTFPVKDLTGNVAFIQRRSVIGKRFINDTGINKSDFIYGLYEVSRDLSIKEVFITESIIDALYLWSVGKKAIALMGSALSKAQINLLKKLTVKKIILAVDNDEAGELCVKKIKSNFPDRLIYRVLFPENKKDVNELNFEEINNLQLKLK